MNETRLTYTLLFIVLQKRKEKTENTKGTHIYVLYTQGIKLKNKVKKATGA